MTGASPSPSKYNAQLQDRDIAILRGFFESRIMTVLQLAAIYFGGRVEAAKKRLQKLKAAGFLRERPRRAYDPSILFLTRKAFKTLGEGGYLDEYPALAWSNMEKRARVSDLTLRHELQVMEFKAAMFSAVAKLAGVSVAEFCTWPLLYEFRARPRDGAKEMMTRPDGFIRLHERDKHGSMFEHAAFLEVDRSTEVLDTLLTRASCYRDFYRAGGLAHRNGRPRSEFEQFPFRVLIVVRNSERRNNLAERLLALRPPILSQVLLTTFTEGISDPLGNIWVTPHSFHQAVENSPYTTSSSSEEVYRRSEAREAFVESKVRKTGILQSN